MDEPLKVELLLEKHDVEKLVELAGSEDAVADYLSKVIRRLYAYHTTFGTDLNLETMITTAQALERKNQEYQALVGELQRRLKLLTVSQVQLMATVALLHSASIDMDNATARRSLH